MKANVCIRQPLMYLSLLFCVSLTAAPVYGLDAVAGLVPSISVGYIWENPRFEEHNVDEVVVETEHADLRLICQLRPPLPKTKNNFLARNDIVQWNKVFGAARQRFSDVYWSDDQSVTAVAFKALKPRHLGNYSCSFLTAERTIHLTAKSLRDTEHLPKPDSHDDFEGLALNLKNTSGLEQLYFKSTYSNSLASKEDFSFPCQRAKNTAQAYAASVHDLRPEDLAVAAFIGGSIMAGVAANASSVLDLFRVTGTSMFRSLDDNKKTPSFSNVLKRFSPELQIIRLSSQDGTSIYGASIDHFISQVDALIEALKTRKGINFQKDWKLITVSLDFDDLCFACNAKSWVSKIGLVKNGLDRIASQIPRAFVNLVLPPNITLLTKYREKTRCSRFYRRQCFCMNQSQTSIEVIKKAVNEFQAHIHHLVDRTHRYNSKSDFAVVIQPLWSHNIHLKDSELEEIFAPDCYHLSSFGHARLGMSLWNNMLQPLYNKSKSWRTDEKWRCPSNVAPYFFTGINSARVVSLNTNQMESTEPSAGLSVGLGVSAGFVGIVFLFSIVIYRNRRRSSVAPAIRVLAQPWRRVKEKV